MQHLAGHAEFRRGLANSQPECGQYVLAQNLPRVGGLPIGMGLDAHCGGFKLRLDDTQVDLQQYH